MIVGFDLKDKQSLGLADDDKRLDFRRRVPNRTTLGVTRNKIGAGAAAAA